MRIFLIVSLIFIQNYSGACTGGVNNQGLLSPTAAYQTIATMDGYYYSMNVVCGNQYNFDFCANGGSVSGLWPEISILNNTGTIQYAFSPYSGGCSTLNWIATFTGTVRILITDSGCFQGQSYNGIMAYNVTSGGAVSPAFTMSVACGGGISTVTGTSGGAFTFNPAPGDGAQINSSTGTVSNGTAGTTYFVQYSICGNSSTQSVTVVDEDCFTLNGTSQYINVGGENCIQLTAEVNDQTGCAWSGSQIDFNSNFSLSLDYYFGNNINGADGNTFTFQPSSSTACGQNGGQLGAGGIPNALSIEFDTYDNDNPAHVYDMSCDHIAVEIDGNLNSGAPYCGPVCAKAGGGNIDDGGVYEVEIAWDATTQQLQVFFNGALRLTCNGDFVNTVFGGQNMVYWGATSATGGLNNQQYFCPSTIVVLPTELSSFTSSCQNDSETFAWTTITESRVSHFLLEYTYDGLIYYDAGKRQAIGNSTAPIDYTLSIEVKDAKQRYYRLKIVDENGDIKYTDLISSQQCNTSTDLISMIKQMENSLQIYCTENSQLTIVNQIGKTIFDGQEMKANFQIDTELLSSGLYYIYASSAFGQIEVKKIIITH